MAGRSYIYINAIGSEFETLWSKIEGLLRSLAADSGGFEMSKPRDNEWLVINLLHSSDIHHLVKKIADLTPSDIYGFEYETAVDGFIYLHHREGKLLRHLDFGMDGEERTWNVVAGEAEDWEEGLFFNAALESEALENIEDLEEEEIQATKEVFRTKSLRVGLMSPFLTHWDYLGIVDAVGLPGGLDGFVHEKLVEIKPPKRPGFWVRIFGRA